MQAPDSLNLRLKALFQLGLASLIPYAWYQFKLRADLLRWQTPARPDSAGKSYPLQPLFDPPSKGTLEETLGTQARHLFKEADEILEGEVRLFGGPPRNLELRPAGGEQHWTDFVSTLPDGEDIKPTWEMGRFGWATTLARAYQLSGDSKYAAAFWRYTEDFLASNPPNQGPHWSSAQEVALRLIALAFCYTIFAASKESSAPRQALLSSSLAAHAQRIPSTLAYARAQNNNHLLSEALGLSTAAALLPEHPQAARWRRLGRRNFLRGLKAQIAGDGSYSQHSANYQRLMLQLALWANLLAKKFAEPLPDWALDKLAASTQWLLNLLDEESGQLPNFGPNDGAYILPLATQPFSDFRPLLQAAGSAFLGRRPLSAGAWDEMALWLSPTLGKNRQPSATSSSPLRLQGKHSWATLRGAHFRGRPGHADQLHLDLWWRGINLAQDAGSYLYTAPTPWDNALSSTRMHNTLTVNGRDQMTRAGRFLWLDWAQAKVLQREENKGGQLVAVSVEHNGYRKLDLLHQRRVRVGAHDAWEVEDRLLSTRGSTSPIPTRLHWLLPDWGWDLVDGALILESPHGHVVLSVTTPSTSLNYSLIRAGEVLLGEAEADPVMGWVSPTYGLKEAALSFIIDCHAPAPLHFLSHWTLPK